MNTRQLEWFTWLLRHDVNLAHGSLYAIDRDYKFAFDALLALSAD